MDLIGTTLDLIKNKLNQYFCNVYQSSDDWVIISNIVNQDGRLYEEAKDKVILFLANIQHETVISTYNKNVPTDNNRYVTIAPPLYINLHLLFYANYFDSNYRDSLSMISSVISFFQQNSSFTPASLPGLNADIDKLTFDMVNMDMTDLNYLLGLAGTKYLPSVLYKVRMIPFISDEMQGQTPEVQGLQDPAQPKEGLLNEEQEDL
ncbi:DUF4255 domain-containing protein [Aliikangiella sp. IMCC44359]|uniref:DUF4255 domain-containing protein n=1 Tax=Aliikangiella sp. IMCC44359 TaxID=3459125 RepID=UPI00403AA87A